MLVLMGWALQWMGHARADCYRNCYLKPVAGLFFREKVT